MANQNNYSQSLKEILDMLNQERPVMDYADRGFNGGQNKGPAPMDPQKLAEFMAQFSQPRPVSSQYDPKKPGSSWLGINSEFMDQYPERGAVNIQPARGPTIDPGYMQTYDPRYARNPGTELSVRIPKASNDGLTRLSPGVYQDRSGKVMRSPQKPKPIPQRIRK